MIAWTVRSVIWQAAAMVPSRASGSRAMIRNTLAWLVRNIHRRYW